MAREKDTDEIEDKPKIVRGDPIDDLINRGYQSGNEHRKVRSRAHAEFLIRAGTVKLP